MGPFKSHVQYKGQPIFTAVTSALDSNISWHDDALYNVMLAICVHIFPKLTITNDCRPNVTIGKFPQIHGARKIKLLPNQAPISLKRRSY